MCSFLPIRDTELYGRDSVAASTRISNPGCYATSSQLLIAPLLPYLHPAAIPTVFGISGYSGAGTISGQNDPDGRPTTVAKVTGESLGGGIRAYSLTDHIHEREAGAHLSDILPSSSATSGGPSKVRIGFIPHIAPWFSGILSTVSVPLRQPISAKEVKNLFEEKYGNEKLIKVLEKGVPELKDVEGNQGWVVGGFQVHRSGERVVLVVRLFSPHFLIIFDVDFSSGWPR